MKHYKLLNGEIRAIGEVGDLEGDQSSLVQEGWVPMTAAEVDLVFNPVLTAEQLYSAKWNQITAQIDALTVTVNGHTYASNKSAMTEINIKISSLDGTETITWYESWGSFQTNKLELQQVVIASCQAEQLIIDQIMGA